MRRPNKSSFAVLAVAVLLAAALPLGAFPQKMMMCLPGFPGTTSQAQPLVDQLLRFLEADLSLEAQSISGVYLSDDAEASEKLPVLKPGLAVVGPSVYARFSGPLKMKVIAKVEASGRGSDTYYVLVRKDGPASLSALSGQSVAVTGISDSQYVYNVMLDRKLPANSLNLSTPKRPMKALRDLHQGALQAVVIDQAIHDSLRELPFADDLHVIHTSKPVPAPAVVVMGQTPAEAQRIGTALLSLCTTTEGKALCSALSISSIRKASDADYADLLKRYRK
jgi:ABC-type phosphate/phosphonate transport system substrate-binding protein